jgi:hypothetical protein
VEILESVARSKQGDGWDDLPADPTLLFEQGP